MGKPPTSVTAWLPSSQCFTRSRICQPKSGWESSLSRILCLSRSSGSKAIDPAANRLSKWVFIEVDPHDEQLPAQELAGKLRPRAASARAGLATPGRSIPTRAGPTGYGGTSPEVERRSHRELPRPRFPATERACQPLEGKETGGVELLIPGREQHDVEIQLLEVVRGRDLDRLEETKLEQHHGERESDARDRGQCTPAAMHDVAQGQGRSAKSSSEGRHVMLVLHVPWRRQSLAADRGRAAATAPPPGLIVTSTSMFTNRRAGSGCPARS